MITLMAILVSELGLFLNLLFPNLNWKNEVGVVKRSFSLIGVMIFFILYIGLFAFIYFKFKIINLNIYLLLPIVFTLTINLVIWNLIKTKGVEIFKKI
ncbi:MULTISPECIES: hypothetical protein [unclassified Romboutsia]|uniref:hypothetical protein n=1 Tax=unclassified Romboutsia TaxID=2626894 RepID=UPI00082162FD|nr:MULTISPECIES: hypothetical protein [unclassified Romboutsia]SCI15135.1 Uncharacterised protein [uncultured Clostridium sp.]